MDETKAAAALFEKSRKVAEELYYQYVIGEPVDEAIEAIAEALHYGDANLDLVRLRMALPEE